MAALTPFNTKKLTTHEKGRILGDVHTYFGGRLLPEGFDLSQFRRRSIGDHLRELSRTIFNSIR